jgi:hypothetical protein
MDAIKESLENINYLTKRLGVVHPTTKLAIEAHEIFVKARAAYESKEDAS